MEVIKSIESVDFFHSPCFQGEDLPPHWAVIVKIEGELWNRELYFSDSPEGQAQAESIKVGDNLPKSYQ
jgi:hypothetical protein